LTKLTDKLLADDHRELDDLLRATFEALASNDDAAFERLDLFWARLAMHIRAEHLHLFPALLKNAPDLPPHVPGMIEKLHDDHDFFMRELVAAVKRMRLINAENSAAARHEAVDRLSAIEERLKEHNRIEENELYPLAASIDPNGGLAVPVKKELDNMPPRFREK